MKFISWNVNGLRAVCGKGFADAFTGFDADFVCLQETKLQAGQIDLEFPGYRSWWNYAERKGYSGVAIYSRLSPLSVSYGIGEDGHDHEGRVLTLEMGDFFLVCCYTPNSQNAENRGELPRRLAYRMEWEDAFRKYLLSLDARKPVIVCGDLNVAHREIDLKNPKTNMMNAGFTPQERAKMSELLDAGFIDTFRYFHPDRTDAYSWWSYRMNARANNAGWRIDYFLASRSLEPRLREAAILSGVTGSDHCPVELVIE